MGSIALGRSRVGSKGIGWMAEDLGSRDEVKDEVRGGPIRA